MIKSWNKNWNLSWFFFPLTGLFRPTLIISLWNEFKNSKLACYMMHRLLKISHKSVPWKDNQRNSTRFSVPYSILRKCSRVNSLKVHEDSIRLESFSTIRKFVANDVSPFSSYLLADLGFRSRREGGSHFRLPDESFNL